MKIMELLIPVLGLVTAVISAVLGYYFSKKNQIVFQERQLKEKYYVDYIIAISNNALTTDLDKAKDELSDMHNKLLLIGSSEVVKSLEEFHEILKPSSQKKNGVDAEIHDELLTKLIMAMRKDLYNGRVNEGYPTIHLIGNRPREEKK